MVAGKNPHIVVQDLTMAYGDVVIQQDLTFTINRGEVFIVMGGSGCGKSTLLKTMVGLKAPHRGQVRYGDADFWGMRGGERERCMRHMGILYQGGALWSALTLGENVALPIREYTRLSEKQIQELVAFKLALVGLSGFEDYHPSEISGGMRKRAALARAMALDPEILFFDEPSAGLDPVTAKLLDDLILEIRDSLGATIVVVTHELASIFAIGDNAIFLDAESRTMIAQGDPKHLAASSRDERLHQFLTRDDTFPSGHVSASGPVRNGARHA
jgi:phospholipid/cholesterol/gamma-HCH transport system ATP-binding protein